MNRAISPLRFNQMTALRAAIFAYRESVDILARCVATAVAASDGDAVIDVMVNGNEPLATALARRTPSIERAGVAVRVWQLAPGDKSNAWNWYVHHVWSPADLTVFLDGYVYAEPDAFRRLAAALARQPASLAATGVPTRGPSAGRLRREMIEHGGLQGNLHALRRSTMELIRARGFRLPVGTYRTDTVLGAALAFGMAPADTRFDMHAHIAVAADATWDKHMEPWWTYRALGGYLRRMRRQALGQLERRAISFVFGVERRAPERLPPTIEGLVLHWADNRPGEARKLAWRSPLTLRAMKALRAGRDWQAASIPPRLLETGPDDRRGTP
ncbi:hypothetical protein [Piscinibacter koreensis]|uniref:Glycosyl transferase family 2 n=1 Tax=Piscinibacter koreensis TaxID=2742824 RepID=A0A7Y6TVP7_9BURK|nr:hypothetical protein [Schlegelella koreensis]NUZ05151.1 hypothetical protein [Schlegelella koreensis]